MVDGDDVMRDRESCRQMDENCYYVGLGVNKEVAGATATSDQRPTAGASVCRLQVQVHLRVQPSVSGQERHMQVVAPVEATAMPRSIPLHSSHSMSAGNSPKPSTMISLGKTSHRS